MFPILPRLRYSCGGSRDLNDPQQIVDCVGYQTACSGEVQVKFGQVETPHSGQGKSTSSSRGVHGHISHTRPLSQPASLLCFIFLFASKHTQLINKSKQRRISSF